MIDPKVSIVLPCYNGATFLSASIESCIRQTFQDWELIIVNDCSTDDSLEIALAYSQKDSRIKVCSNETNKKLPATLNIGFAQSQGEYLTWTSHDNIMHEEMLHDFVQYLDEHENVGLVTANYSAIDSSDKQLYTVSMPDSMLYLPRYNTICYAFMYRRIVLDTVGGYNENLFLIEDYEYWIRIWQKFKIEKIDKVLYYTRVCDETLTMSRKKDIAQKLLEVRLMYFRAFDKYLQPYPKLHRDFYISILDQVHGVTRIKYVCNYVCKSPFEFAPYYLFWYRPKHIMKKFGFFKRIRSCFKPCRK